MLALSDLRNMDKNVKNIVTKKHCLTFRFQDKKAATYNVFKYSLAVKEERDSSHNAAITH